MLQKLKNILKEYEINYVSGKKILTIIPARGGSKGLPRKNIKIICGKPLIYWTIQAAIRSGIDTVVSTDDKEIAQIAVKHGALVPFLRPKELASDRAPTIKAVLYTIERLEKAGKIYDLIVILEPTSPLRKKDDISNALKFFMDNYDKADSLISVGEIKLEHPLVAKKIIGDGFTENFISDTAEITQRQEYPKGYFPYGVIYVAKTEFLKKEKKCYSERSLAYIIERWQNYEIDDIYDFWCVEKIMKEKIGEIL